MNIAYQGHDYPPNLPLPIPLSTTLLTVEESQSYALAGLDSDEEWAALGGLAFGYVRLPTPYGQRRMFVTTMFHELHCLRLLNLAFDESHIISDHHIAHCLNYLRQMALCDADLTLEYAGWEESARTEGATHICRDWTYVYEFVDANWQEWKDIAASQDM